METGAEFSPNRRYRYRLHRFWGDEKPCVFVMLNPSTADEVENDPTVERCQRRAQSMGFGGLIVVNIFALRSTDPRALYEPTIDPVGAENDAAIRRAVQEGGMVVCAWGKHGHLKLRGREVLNLILSEGATPFALKVNSDGTPAHPLYIGYKVLPRAMRKSELEAVCQ